MTDRPTPERRYRGDDRRIAYELGWHQMRDHDGSALFERFAELGSEGLAAALFGASDALAELAEQAEAAAELEEASPA